MSPPDPDGDRLSEELESLSESEREEYLRILSLAADGNLTEYRKFIKTDFIEEPVHPLKFIDDDDYLGRPLKLESGSPKVYDYWRKVIASIYESDAIEVILTGPIGSGKTTIAEIYLAYMLYECLCLRDPFEYYQMIRANPIALLFFSLSKDLSEVSLFRGFQELILASPWFRDHGTVRGVRNQVLTFEERNIEYALGSPFVVGWGITGRSILGGALDEISEITTAKERESGGSLELSKYKALKIYQAAARRIESRFLQGGPIPGKLFLCSSKGDEAAFLERYVEKVKGQPHVIVFDDSLWVIKPKRFYSGRTFPVAVGDRFRSPKVLGPKEKASDYSSQEYDVLQVPIEYYRAFTLDVVGALRDIAGVTSSGTRKAKLIPRAEYIKACVDGSRRSMFTQEVVYLGLDDSAGLEDFFLLPEEVSPHPRFMHIDIGLTGDALGMAMVHISGRKRVERVIEDGTSNSVEDDVITVDFAIRVSNLEGSEIPLWKIRLFLLFLRNRGYPIELVTFDGYQSADIRQLLQRARFNSEIFSVDRNDEAYLAVRSAIYEGRVSYYHYPPLLKELADLEHDKLKKKVDHPGGGSKDVADSVAGALAKAQGEAPAGVSSVKMVEALELMLEEKKKQEKKKGYWWI